MLFLSTLLLAEEELLESESRMAKSGCCCCPDNPPMEEGSIDELFGRSPPWEFGEGLSSEGERRGKTNCDGSSADSSLTVPLRVDLGEV